MMSWVPGRGRRVCKGIISDAKQTKEAKIYSFYLLRAMARPLNEVFIHMKHVSNSKSPHRSNGISFDGRLLMQGVDGKLY